MDGFLGRLYELRKLDIYDPKVRDALCDFEWYYKSELWLRGIRADISQHVESFIINVNYMCIMYMDDAIPTCGGPLIKIYEYDLFQINTESGVMRDSVTVEEMFFPDTKPLFDILLNSNCMVDDTMFYISNRYALSFMNYEFENDLVKIHLISRARITEISYGYMISKNFIILMSRSPFNVKNIVILDYNEQLITKIIGMSKYDQCENFIFEYKSDIINEPMTFRQFLGISNVKSARNF